MAERTFISSDTNVTQLEVIYLGKAADLFEKPQPQQISTTALLIRQLFTRSSL